MRISINILLIISFLTPCHANDLRQGKDYALFFAVDNYAGTGWPNLKNPVNDARALAEVLETAFQFEVHLFENYTRKDIETVIRQWQEKSFTDDTQLFVFFSGHGDYNDFYKRGYFIPSDGRIGDYTSYMDLTILGDIIAQIPCKHTLLAIDACYSGTADRQIIFRGNTFARPGATQKTERDILVDRQLAFASKLLITSGGKERTPDGDQHSPFAEGILQGLRNAYTHSDGLLTFGDLIARLERVSPTPHQGELIGHEDGGFVFVSKFKPVKTKLINHTSELIEEVATPKGTVDPQIFERKLENGNMVFIKGGTFLMGDDQGQPDEQPVHPISVDDFYMSRFEVTNAEFAIFLNEEGNALMGGKRWYESEYGNIIESENGYFQPEPGFEDHPVTAVTWYGAIAFCNWRSKIASLQPVYRIDNERVQFIPEAIGYRLPSEVEWEYAARSRGRHLGWSGTSEVELLSNYANCSGNEDGFLQTAPVGMLQPNDLGLYDMSGNVLEWCWDGYEAYKNEEEFTPKVLRISTKRVIRGGSWFHNSQDCRSSRRFNLNPSQRLGGLGFRIALSNRTY